MATIEAIGAREILDSRGNPTVEVEVGLDDGTFGRAAVPSGASTGRLEAVELRDGDKGATSARAWRRPSTPSSSEIAPQPRRLRRHRPAPHRRRRCSTLDGTPNKGNLGANAILGVSLAVAHAAAESADLPLYRYLGGPTRTCCPSR